MFLSVLFLRSVPLQPVEQCRELNQGRPELNSKQIAVCACALVASSPQMTHSVGSAM